MTTAPGTGRPSPSDHLRAATTAPRRAAAADTPATSPSGLRSLLRRVTVAIGGAVLLLVGAVLLVLPGPGMLLIFGGLAVLSREFPWADRLAERLRVRVRAAAARLRRARSASPARP